MGVQIRNFVDLILESWIDFEIPELILVIPVYQMALHHMIHNIWKINKIIVPNHQLKLW